MKQNLPPDISYALEKLETSDGSEKIDLLNTLSHYYQETDSKSALRFSEESVKLSEDINDKSRLAQSLLLLGKANYYSVDYVSAIDNLTSAALLFESFEDKKNEISALTFTGTAQSYLGDHTRALTTLFKALKLSQSVNDTSSEGEVLMQLGLAYLGSHDSELALEYLNKSYEIVTKSDDKKAIASITGNLGNVYLRLKDFNKAIESYKKCKDIFEELNRPVEIGRAYLNIGTALAASGKFDEALVYAMKCLETFSQLGKQDLICNSLLTIGAIYYDKKDNNAALQYFKEAQNIGEQYSLKKLLENIYGSIADASSRLGDYKTAYEYHQMYHDSVNSRLRQTADVKTRYLNIAHKVDTLKKESELLIEKNSELKTLNERLTQLNAEKNEFLGIAAHDLKNPLTSISLSAATIKKYLNVFPKEKIENHLDKIAETSNRMKNIVTNLININAIESGEYNVHKTEIDLSALLKYITDDFQHRAAAKDITIVYSQNKSAKIITDENAIYSILDNLISNAIKYSSIGSYIYIEFEVKDKAVIKIKDNGLGIKDSEKEKIFLKFSRLSNKPTAGENSTGLGLSIVKKLTELIGGNISFVSEYGKGTTFSLELPI